MLTQPDDSMPESQRSHIRVENGVIYVTLLGESHRHAASIAQRLLADFKQQVHESLDQTGKAYVLVDYRQLRPRDVTTASRLAIKEAFSQPFTALAAVGNNRLAEVAMYLMNAGGAQNRTRHFSSVSKAQRWLEEVRHPHKRRSRLLGIAGLLIAAFGVLGLARWVGTYEGLERTLAALPPMNPMGAFGLLLLAGAFVSIWRKWHVATGVFTSSVVALGLLSILPVDIDHLVLKEKIWAAGAHSQLGDSAGICFIAAGIGLLTLPLTSLISRAARAALGVIILGLAVFNAFGVLYARTFIYGIGDNFAMALGLSAAFIICGVVLIDSVTEGKNGSVLKRVTRFGWVIIGILVLVQTSTFAGWQEAIKRNSQDSQSAFTARTDEVTGDIQARLQAYIDTLAGFRGLFAASSDVNEGEFRNYYTSLQLEEKYPGFRAVSFISRVHEKDLAAFVKKRQADTSANAASRPGFAVQNKSASSPHYILTYLPTNLSSTALGTDFTDVPERRKTYETAIATNQPAVSETLQFNATATAPASRGFFITMPITVPNAPNDDARRPGLVSAVFNYGDFFNNAASSSNLFNDINIRISDMTSGETLFSHKDTANGQLQLVKAIPVANRNWNIEVSASPTFGISESQANLPSSVLSSGTIISMMLIVVFLMQSRARQRALRLADQITADLQFERNRAVAVQQKDDAILSSIGDAVFALDTDERITLFNPSAEAISGFKAEEAIGKVYSKVLHFELADGGGLNNNFIKTALSGKLASMENHTLLKRKDGTKVPVADSAAPIHDISGKIVGAIIVFRDVSKEYELDRAKTEFVSLASHQLRTPLSAINWYAEMLLDGTTGKLKKDQESYIREIYEGNQRMIELVNSLLNVSRLDLGKLPDEPSGNNVNVLISSLMKELSTSVAEKKLIVNTRDIAPKLPEVFADPKLLRMILQNLLSNAVKYTPAQGSITITARSAPADTVAAAHLRTDKDYLYFSVSDTGFGIPAAQQPKIFSKLFRADNVRVLDVEGTGLGLYIVKEVVAKLGGHIWFESVENKGSTFHVVLPFNTKRVK